MRFLSHAKKSNTKQAFYVTSGAAQKLRGMALHEHPFRRPEFGILVQET